MQTEYKYMLIENESEFKSDLLSEIENIKSYDELTEYINKLVSIQYYQGIFYDASEYAEILSNKINEIIENTYDEIKKDSSVLNLDAYDSDESEYKLYITKYLEYYDLFIKLEYKTELTDSMNIKAEYLSEYSYNDADNKIFKPEYLDEIIIYESESDYHESISELINSELCFNAYNHEYKRYNSLSHRYFNYDEYISDELDNNELFELEYKYEIRYIKDYNRLY